MRIPGPVLLPGNSFPVTAGLVPRVRAVSLPLFSWLASDAHSSRRAFERSSIPERPDGHRVRILRVIETELSGVYQMHAPRRPTGYMI
jgi:hypothetical protein